MFEVWLILVLVASSCSLVGSLLVLQNQSMLADALSHSVLLGIVLGFFISHSLESPLLMAGATIFGVLSVLAIDLLHSQKIAHDAATGLVFSFFFAVAVLLISLFARNVHLDVDMVLMGEVLFAPLHRMDIFGLSVPIAMVKSAVTLLANVTFFICFFQPMKLFVFDKTQAQLAGMRTQLLQLAILVLVSLSTVLSFDTIGSMTVVVFLVAPSLSVLPWTSSFWQLLLGSVLVAAVTASLGYALGYGLDLTLSGTTSVASLLVLVASVGMKHLQQKANYQKISSP